MVSQALCHAFFDVMGERRLHRTGNNQDPFVWADDTFTALIRCNACGAVFPGTGRVETMAHVETCPEAQAVIALWVLEGDNT